MTTTLLNRETVIVTEELRAEAAGLIDDACDEPLERLLISVGGAAVEIPAALSSFLVAVIERAAEGGTMTLMSTPEELTTTAAADMLGVSRPTLMKLIEAGEIQSHKVGSHSRLKSADVLELRTKRAAARKIAFEKLRELEEEVGEV